jgi:hypothetical protein
MSKEVEEGFMAFIADGAEGIGSVRHVEDKDIVIYVENAGEFTVPKTAIIDVHSQKVMLDPRQLSKVFLRAVGHVHDGEDPETAG